MNILMVYWQPHPSLGFFGGAWCPYKVDKLVPCRVHNGTESYLGPNICWKTLNGSFACTKRMLVRPKYVNTYKRVSETVYKCCPGLSGKNCHQECFNCSTLGLLEDRLGYLEKRLNQIQVLSPHRDDKTFGSGQKDVKNSISDEEDDDQDFDRLHTLNIINDLSTRLVNVESQLAKLIHSVNEFLKFKSTTDHSIVQEEQEEEKEKQDTRVRVPIIIPTEKITTTTTIKTSMHLNKQTIQSRGLNGHHHHHQTAIRLLESNLERGDIASTLNDDGDYEEDASSSLSASTEEYADQLYTHGS